MNILTVQEKMVEYFNQELKWAEQAIDRKIGNPLEIVENANQRMLGVANFCQELGLEYDFIEHHFCETKNKLADLL